MVTIKKAVIPCAGMGTRFLPITKAVPKELLPIIDTPVLAYIVEEAVQSGIEQVLIVTSPKKECIKKYFEPDSELEDKLLSEGKIALWETLKNIHSKAEIKFCYQYEPKGSGDAVYHAKDFTGDEPFALAWGDDLMVASQPVMGQLASAYDKCGQTIIGVQRMDSDDIVKYGVAKIASSDGRLHKLDSIIEKPPIDLLPSRLASLGRYVLTKDVYEAIKQTPKGVGNEYQLTDALALLCSQNKAYAYEFEGKRYDMGDKFGAMQAYTEFALKSSEFGVKYANYIKELAKKI